MKNIIKLTLSFAFASIAFFPDNANAQGRFGATPEDSSKCVQNISFLKDEMSQNNYEAALPLYRELMSICPKSTRNLYIWGIRIMKNLADNETDEVKKAKYVDTVLMLYDKRIEYFSNREKLGDLYYRRADELAEYRENDRAAIIADYEKAIANGNTTLDIYTQIMQQTKFAYDEKTIEGDVVTKRYNDLLAQINTLPDSEEKTTAKNNIDGLFASMPELNSVDNVVAMYEPQFRANPNDVDLVKKMLYRLSNTEGGANTQLYADGAEALYKADPNAEAAFLLAQMFIIKGDNAKGMQYVEEAIKNETDNSKKAKYQIMMANDNFKNGRISQALSYARQAASNDSNAGEPYMIIGNCFAKLAAAGGSCDDFDKRAVMWVVVDQFQKAKSIDPKLSGTANQAIASYSRYFPTYNEIFLREYSVGQKYTVNCSGVSGVTTIRAARE